MRDHHDGRTAFLIQIAEAFQQHFRRLGIERTCRLVCKHKLRVCNDGTSRSDTLFLTAGHLIGIFLQDFGNAELFSNRFDRCVDLTCRTLLNGKRKGYVLIGGQGIKQVEILKDEAQFFTAEFIQSLAFESSNVRVFEEDMPCGHSINGGDAVEQGGLSAARSTHNGNKFATIHRKRNIINGFRETRLVPIVFFNLLYVQKFHVNSSFLYSIIQHFFVSVAVLILQNITIL